MKRVFFITLIGLLFPAIAPCQNKAVKERLELKYEYVFYDKESGYYEVIDKDRNYGICDAKGREIITPQFKSIYETKVDNEYVFQVELSNGKYGYYDKNGKMFISPIYTSAWYYDKDGIYIVKDGDKTGWIDKSGKVLIPPKYTSIYYDKKDEIYIVKNGDKVGWIDKSGKVLFPLKYTNIWYDKNANMFHVENGNYKGYCDAKQREIIPPNKYTDITHYHNGFFVSIGDKKGWCDSLGQEKVEPKYDELVIMEADEFHGQRYIVELDGKKGLLGEQGEVVIPIVYDSMYIAYEGLMEAKKQKWGYLSAKDGSTVIPFVYDNVSQFKDGVAKVQKNGQTILLPNPLKAVVGNANQPKAKGHAVSTYPIADSEVDKTIPNGKKTDANTYAFIIANENYPMAKVPYALNDGWTFEQYCKKTLGIKDENVHLFEDATGGNIALCVEQMRQTARAAGGKATIIFYYAGHAFPDEDSKSGYLLPVDGDSKNIATGYSLKKLYKELNDINAKQIVCFIDACFSGATREDNMLIAGRGVAIKVNDEVPQGNMVVMTSATGAETAHSFEEMHHGLFTYYLLEKLQQSKGDVTLGELSEYVTKMVKRKSVLINQKKQSPTVIPSPTLQTVWQDIRL